MPISTAHIASNPLNQFIVTYKKERPFTSRTTTDNPSHPPFHRIAYATSTSSTTPPSAPQPPSPSNTPFVQLLTPPSSPFPPHHPTSPSPSPLSSLQPITFPPPRPIPLNPHHPLPPPLAGVSHEPPRRPHNPIQFQKTPYRIKGRNEHPSIHPFIHYPRIPTTHRLSTYPTLSFQNSAITRTPPPPPPSPPLPRAAPKISIPTQKTLLAAAALQSHFFNRSFSLFLFIFKFFSRVCVGVGWLCLFKREIFATRQAVQDILVHYHHILVYYQHIPNIPPPPPPSEQLAPPPPRPADNLQHHKILNPTSYHITSHHITPHHTIPITPPTTLPKLIPSSAFPFPHTSPPFPPRVPFPAPPSSSPYPPFSPFLPLSSSPPFLFSLFPISSSSPSPFFPPFSPFPSLIFSSKLTQPIPSHFIPFHFISSHFISFHSISFHPISSHFIPSHPIPFHFIPIPIPF